MVMGTQTTVPLCSLKNVADSMGVAPATTVGIEVDRINFPTESCGPILNTKLFSTPQERVTFLSGNRYKYAPSYFPP